MCMCFFAGTRREVLHSEHCITVTSPVNFEVEEYEWASVLSLVLKYLYAATTAPPTATTPPPIATGTAHAGAVPIPIRARAGPAHPPIAAPAVANGIVAAIPTPPVASPTLEPRTPPATPPIAAPAALIAPVVDVPAATIPAADAAEPTIVAPIAVAVVASLTAVFLYL